jgi:hypothetical protein
MQRYGRKAVLWLVLLWQAAAWPAMACQWRLDIAIDKFLEADAEHAVVFVGEVVAVTPGRKDDGQPRIMFRSFEVLWGHYDVTLPTQAPRPRGKTGCEELDTPFAPRLGSQWLIFGKVVDGLIVPDRVLSHEVVNGQIDPKVRELLKRHGAK